MVNYNHGMTVNGYQPKSSDILGKYLQPRDSDILGKYLQNTVLYFVFNYERVK